MKNQAIVPAFRACSVIKADGYGIADLSNDVRTLLRKV